jgi:hypothetical protein
MVDHINGNPLDNRRSNLRLATHIQNQWNTHRPTHKKAGFRGVYRHNNFWLAQICFFGKKIRAYNFETPEEAARYRDKLAIQYHGEFAVLNFPKAADEKE